MNTSASSPNLVVSTCPVCREELVVTVLSCPRCTTALHGTFALPPLARLPAELQEIVVAFLRCRGNLKELERELGISYPTVCKRLDAINYLLAAMAAPNSARTRILRQLEAGELTPAEAVAQLKALPATAPTKE